MASGRHAGLKLLFVTSDELAPKMRTLGRSQFGVKENLWALRSQQFKRPTCPEKHVEIEMNHRVLLRLPKSARYFWAGKIQQLNMNPHKLRTAWPEPEISVSALVKSGIFRDLTRNLGWFHGWYI